jgi:hypothetical protein
VQKGERRPAARRGAKNANNKDGELCGSPYCLYAALQLLPVPDASGLACFLAFALAADLNLPTEVCTGTATTKEQSQRRAFNLVPRMVFNDRPTYKERHAAELIMARRDISTQRPNTLPQTCLSSRSFSLAVLRRTIHSRYLPSSRSHWGLIHFFRVRNA